MRRIICVVFGLILSSAVFAQGAPASAPTNPNILQGIQQLQQNDVIQSATLSDIQKALQGLTPPPVGNVLNTSILTFAVSKDQTGEYRCWVSNTSATDKTIVLELVDQQGVTHPTTPFTLAPAKSEFTGLSVTSGTTLSAFRCRITVQNGTKQDVVGALVLSTFTGPNLDIAEVSVDAR